MTDKERLNMWLVRAHALESSLEEAIKVIKTLRDVVQWSSSYKAEIDEKIREFEDALIPF